MLHIGWYVETSPGVLGPRQGGHVVTLDGYTSDNRLLIRDPYYAEGIIEPDSDFADLTYVYSTTNDQRLRAEIEAATTVSPKPIIWDGLVVPGDYALVTTNDSLLQESYISVYTDYVSVGLDQVALQNPIPASGQPSSIIIHPQPAAPSDPVTGFRVQFNHDNTEIPIEIVALDLTGAEPVIVNTLGTWDNTDLEWQVIAAFGPSEIPLAPPRSQVELFIDREVFGTFAVDSFFDVWTELDPDGTGLGEPSWDMFSFGLGPQWLSDAWDGSTSDPDRDALFSYFAETADSAVFAAEIAARLSAIDSIAVSEPPAWLLLVCGLGTAVCLHGSRRRA